MDRNERSDKVRLIDEVENETKTRCRRSSPNTGFHATDATNLNQNYFSLCPRMLADITPSQRSWDTEKFVTNML
eukprot:CAMPEP_0167757846 /NCGR_PEP_ID=MMETSP0110_2-20121227/10148_1 /TAXON_ID=629695 /ORGANISM="Gymnochlora sp., Strain CCMP2014" /LENGTH=73 /DNA_ID=CAMNT_0007644073 /DNA_START=595 /DNA_END=816 /DNA_ORIENTATION=+